MYDDLDLDAIADYLGKPVEDVTERDLEEYVEARYFESVGY